METCKICFKEYKNLGSHVRQSHEMSMKDYTELPDVESPAPEPAVEEDKVSAADIREGIFGTDKEYADLPLSEFLKDFDIEEPDLRKLVRQYKGEAPVPVTQAIENSQKTGQRLAKDLVNQMVVKTNSLNIAEALTKHYQTHFVAEVSTSGGTKPKQWVLQRKT